MTENTANPALEPISSDLLIPFETGDETKTIKELFEEGKIALQYTDNFSKLLNGKEGSITYIEYRNLNKE